MEVGTLAQVYYTLCSGILLLTLMQDYIDSVSTLLFCFCYLRYIVGVGTLDQVKYTFGGCTV